MNDHATISLRLPRQLLSVLEDEARSQGVSQERLVAEMLTRQLGSIPHKGAGRCSLRTGLCSEGPTPLPLQQPC